MNTTELDLEPILGPIYARALAASEHLHQRAVSITSETPQADRVVLAALAADDLRREEEAVAEVRAELARLRKTWPDIDRAILAGAGRPADEHDPVWWAAPLLASGRDVVRCVRTACGSPFAGSRGGAA